MSDFLLMCIEFFKTGLFSVGGGLATLPFLHNISTKHPDWFSLSDMADMLAVAESTPGPIGVNMSTYVGFHSFGVFGGVCTTLSLVLPSFIVIMLISKIWEKYKTNEKVMKIFAALRATAIGLIFSAGVMILKTAMLPSGYFSIVCLVLFLFLFICTRIPKLKDLHPILYILFAAVIGIMLKL